MSNSFSYKDAMTASLSYFGEEELPAKIVVDKYLLRNNEEELVEQSPTDIHLRIASELARVEATKFKHPLSKQQIFEYLDGFRRIIPQGSPIAGIGNPYQYVTISNCYVVPPMLDSYGGIHRTDEHLSQISKRRGGVGFDISQIRPAGTSTKNSSRTSTGIVPFMERASNSIREVGQSGRRGALMITISVHHPEVLDFATVKRDLKRVTGANISIRLTDEFLNAVAENRDYEQRWPVEDSEPKFRKMVNAREVWTKIIENAHAVAEPGLLFWDTIIRESPADCYSSLGFRTISTNPCSELPLSILDSCRLLVINLFHYVNEPFTPGASFDFGRFDADAQIAQRLMDDIVDLEAEAISKIISKIKSDPEPDSVKAVELEMWQTVWKNCFNGRRTGTGITALGDTLAALGFKYGSNDSIKMTESIYRQLKLSCYRSSVEIAKEVGPFPIWNPDLEKDNPFLSRIKEEDHALYLDMLKFGRRNIALLTTAPVGTISNLAAIDLENNIFGTTSGIEPAFMLEYTRKKKHTHDDKNARVDSIDEMGDKWQHFTVYHPAVRKWMQVTGETDITKSPWWNCCAEDIDWQQRVKLQAAANRHVDHAISSTVNLPEDVTVEKVAEIYEAAWKAGCKGITVYRNNCRSGVLVKKEVDKTDHIKRPRELPCDIYHVAVKGERHYVFVGLLNGEPYEVMASKEDEHFHVPRSWEKGIMRRVKRGFYQLVVDDKTVDNANQCGGDEEALTRMTSTALRHGVEIGFVVQQLEKSRGEIQSFGKSVARALKHYIKDGTKISGESCSACGSENLIRQEGCSKCLECGSSKCS